MKTTIKNVSTKFEVKYSSKFSKSLKKIKKQGKDLIKLEEVVTKIANGETLESKYKNHKLKNDGIYTNCYECHIEPDWLLIYRYNNNELILLLVNTGSHADLFNM